MVGISAKASPSTSSIPVCCIINLCVIIHLVRQWRSIYSWWRSHLCGWWICLGSRLLLFSNEPVADSVSTTGLFSLGCVLTDSSLPSLVIGARAMPSVSPTWGEETETWKPEVKVTVAVRLCCVWVWHSGGDWAAILYHDCTFDTVGTGLSSHFVSFEPITVQGGGIEIDGTHTIYTAFKYASVSIYKL
jgi:hypothetical protein